MVVDARHLVSTVELALSDADVPVRIPDRGSINALVQVITITAPLPIHELGVGSGPVVANADSQPVPIAMIPMVIVRVHIAVRIFAVTNAVTPR